VCSGRAGRAGRAGRVGKIVFVFAVEIKLNINIIGFCYKS
jgi:hypothetical protein